MARTHPHKNRVAIVTGGGHGQGGKGGIGRGIALRLAADGANLLIADLDEGGKETAREAAELGVEATHFVGDLSQEENAQALIDHALRKWGRLDILINNAGGGGVRPFLTHTRDSFVETINRNLWTTLWCCHKALPHMVERNYGRIVNIGADSVRNGLDNHAGYNAAKGGVHALATGLAREFALNDITVNVVAPTSVETPWVKNMLKHGAERSAYLNDPDNDLSKYFRMIPKGRGAEVEEVASVVSYLASDEAGFITGQVISINGGSTML